MAKTDFTKINLGDLQGNILRGHGRNYTANLFVKFGTDLVKTKALLGFIRTKVTSQTQQDADRAAFKATGVIDLPFHSLYLTSKAYDVLSVTTKPVDPKFRAGMAASQNTLSDPVATSWDPPFKPDLHALILIGNDREDKLDQLVSQMIGQINTAGATLLGTERGRVLRNARGDGIEHFGYVDGRSQPLFFQDDIDGEAAHGGTDLWNPDFDAFNTALVADPQGVDTRSLGTYFIFRKLEQNVRRFKEMESALAESLQLESDDAEIAGAMAVGRFEDGTPVTLQNSEGMIHPIPNNFNYKSDASGSRCPFHGHIRKMNPRNQPSDDIRIMARRGIPFGKRDADLADMPESGVGLLFMACNIDISRQFEFVQQSWANNDSFPAGGTGKDPIIGQPGFAIPATAQKWPKAWGDAARVPCAFTPFVRMRGGEYFFAPSLSGITRLAT